MKKLATCLILIATIMLISCEEQTISVPADFTASQGTYIGVVHIAYGNSDGQGLVYRFNEDNAEWEEISWTWSNQWDDNGWSLPNNKLIPGKEYRYKMRVYVEGEGEEFSDYSQEITGYAFKAIGSEISSLSRENNGEDVDITINWTNPNDLSNIKNLQDIYYDIYRTEDGTLADYQMIKSVYSSFNNGNPQYEWSYEDTWLDPSKNFTYKIITRYMYNFTDVNGDYRDNIYYTVDGTSVEDTVGGGDGQGNPVMEYTATDLGQVHNSSTGGIIDLKMHNVDGTLYVGLIGDASIYGSPQLYQYSGSSWQNVWTTLPQDIEYEDIEYALTSTHSYLAGVRDSVSVFEWDGSAWSANLTPDNLGQVDSPSDVAIASLNDELYMAIKQHPDYNLEVMKWDGTAWNNIGGDTEGIIATGSISDMVIENINGVLYLHYIIDNTLYIQHLNSGTWASDLTWTQDYITNVHLVEDAGTLYFSAGSNSIATYSGGVYQVSGTNAVESLIPDGAEWLLDPMDIGIDSDGSLVIASINYESPTSIYPYLSVFDGSEWKTISADFTGGMDPVALSTIGTDIYYIYGDAATENGAGDPTSLQSMNLVK